MQVEIAALEERYKSIDGRDMEHLETLKEALQEQVDNLNKRFKEIQTDIDKFGEDVKLARKQSDD